MRALRELLCKYNCVCRALVSMAFTTIIAGTSLAFTYNELPTCKIRTGAIFIIFCAIYVEFSSTQIGLAEHERKISFCQALKAVDRTWLTNNRRSASQSLGKSGTPARRSSILIRHSPYMVMTARYASDEGLSRKANRGSLVPAPVTRVTSTIPMFLLISTTLNTN